MAIVRISYLLFKGPIDFDAKHSSLSDYSINFPPLHEIQKYEMQHALYLNYLTS